MATRRKRTQNVPAPEFPSTEFPLNARMTEYVETLARRATGIISFRTGAGRIFRDLMMHWPTLEKWEDEAHELCTRIADAVYPLTNALYAQAVELTIEFSPKIIVPPVIETLSTYVVFDAQSKSERRFFISPNFELPDPAVETALGGVTVVCRPLNYRYHTIKDDRKNRIRPRVGMYELPQRMINELYEKPDFVPRERNIIAGFITQITDMPDLVGREERLRAISAAHYRELDQPEVSEINMSRRYVAAASLSAISALPPAARALERKLMTEATEKKTNSADLRLGLRRVAQSVRSLFPIAMVEEAARRETLARARRQPAAQLAATQGHDQQQPRDAASTPNASPPISAETATQPPITPASITPLQQMQRNLALPPGLVAPLADQTPPEQPNPSSERATAPATPYSALSPSPSVEQPPVSSASVAPSQETTTRTTEQATQTAPANRETPDPSPNNPFGRSPEQQPGENEISREPRGTVSSETTEPPREGVQQAQVSAREETTQTRADAHEPTSVHAATPSFVTPISRAPPLVTPTVTPISLLAYQQLTPTSPTAAHPTVPTHPDATSRRRWFNLPTLTPSPLSFLFKGRK